MGASIPEVSWKATFLPRTSPLNFLKFGCLKGEPFMYKYLYLPKVFWNLVFCFQETFWNPATLRQTENSWASSRCRWSCTTELKPSHFLWPLRTPQKPLGCHFRKQGGASVQAPLARPQNLRSKSSWHESSSRPDMEGHRWGSWEPGWGLGSPRLWQIHLKGPSQEPTDMICSFLGTQTLVTFGYTINYSSILFCPPFPKQPNSWSGMIM